MSRQIYAGAGNVLQTVAAQHVLDQPALEHIWGGRYPAPPPPAPGPSSTPATSFHADAERYRRLHVIVGDSNMSEHASFLKVGATSLLLLGCLRSPTWCCAT
ncbi:MAG: proteasome accessory factor PafA2 family protein [Acidimicrobiales bacterium]